VEDSIILQGHPDENSTRPRNICDFDDLGPWRRTSGAGGRTLPARETPAPPGRRRGKANWPLAVIEPVSALRKRKLEKRQLRQAPKRRRIR